MKLPKAILSSEKLLRLLLNLTWSIIVMLLMILTIMYSRQRLDAIFHALLFGQAFMWLVGMLIIRVASPIDPFFITDEGETIESLRASERTLRTIVERSPDSVSATDLLGRFIYASPQTAIMHGYDSPEELIGKSAFDLFPPRDVARAARFMQLTREGGQIKNVEFTLLRKDGSHFQGEMSASLITNEAGLPVAFMSILRDITERKQVEEKLRLANEQLQTQISEIEVLQETLREQVVRDPLTDLFNRRYMQEAARQEHARAARENYPYSLIMIDLDKLKDINDTYGHAAGDMAILALADQIKRKTRIEDIICRYGGDEFLVILHDTSTEIAVDRVESWRINLIENPILLRGQSLQVSFTAGVATFPTHGKTLDEILRHADMALYRAKAEGGNQVMMYN